jgi:hypothetical protein
MWGVIGTVLGLFYVGAPTLIYAQQRASDADDAVAPLTPADLVDLSDEARSYLDSTEAALQQEGFRQPVRLAVRAMKNSTGYCSGLEHEDRSAVVAAMVVQVRAQGKTVVRCIINIRSDFRDGCTMFTSNTKTSRTFPKVPNHDSARFPSVTDPVALWRIHRRRVGARARTVPTVPVMPDGDVLAHAKREIAEGQERWLAIRYFQRMRQGGVRPTIRGAALMVWRMLRRGSRSTTARTPASPPRISLRGAAPPRPSPAPPRSPLASPHPRRLAPIDRRAIGRSARRH